MRSLDHFLKEVRNGTLADEARRCITEKLKPEEKIKVLYEMAMENDYDLTRQELKEDMQMSDAKVFEQEILKAAEAGIAVEHNVRDYSWPFSPRI